MIKAFSTLSITLILSLTLLSCALYKSESRELLEARAFTEAKERGVQTSGCAFSDEPAVWSAHYSSPENMYRFDFVSSIDIDSSTIYSQTQWEDSYILCKFVSDKPEKLNSQLYKTWQQLDNNLAEILL